MKNYKRLGDHIREVNVRNRELEVTKLVGLTIDKAFIPSVANVIGTDLSNYKVIRKEQFACSLMQVSRDGKMPVAMFEEDEDAYWDQYFKEKYGTTKTKEKPKNYNVSAANIAKDYDLYLDILIIDDDTGEEITLSASGNTKAECWANLFLENPDICFNQITDYSFI